MQVSLLDDSCIDDNGETVMMGGAHNEEHWMFLKCRRVQ